MEVVLSDKQISTALFASLETRHGSEEFAGLSEIVLEDKTNGTPYKKHMEDTTEMGITLTTTTDGAKVFNCNKTSLWPVQYVINELPVSMGWANIHLGGLWFQRGHPQI